VTLSGNAVFSSATSYTCYGSDTDAPVTTLSFSYASGSSFDASASTGPSGQAYRFVCEGS
jgi:hypothetical protein